jgi:flagellar biosynthetic protein FlhB
MLGGVLVNVFQVGLLWLPDRVAPDLSRVSPLAGLKRIFSLSGTSRLGFGLVKVLIVAGVAFVVLWMRWNEVVRASGLDVAHIGKLLIDLSISSTLWVARSADPGDFRLACTAEHERLRMSHQEVQATK